MMIRTLQTKDDILRLPWQLIPANKIPKKSGVYRLINKFTGIEEYIGESVNLNHRLFQSTHPVYKPGIHAIWVYFTNNEKERHYTEYRTIMLLKPALNKRAGKISEWDSKVVDKAYRDIFDVCDKL